MQQQPLAPYTSMNAGVISLPRHTCRRKPETLVVNRSSASVSQTLSVTAEIQLLSRVHRPWKCVKMCCFLEKYLKCFGVAWCLFSGHVHFPYSPVFRNQNYVDLHCSSLPSRGNDCWVQTGENLGSKFLRLFWKFFSSKNKIDAFL